MRLTDEHASAEKLDAREYMEKISIIIPVYNVEPYIRKCLDSIISQTYENLEILLINDGSTDSSGRICDEYAAKDRRIRVFHKDNAGVSSAKNLGLEHMTGSYAGFVDSDDWIEPDMYETLYRAVKTENVQISVAGYFKDTDSQSIPVANMAKIPGGIIETEDMLLNPLKRDCYMGFCGYMWNKLFQAGMFHDGALRFDESINYGEDVLLYTEFVLAGKCKGVYIDKPLYHYYQRSTAISKSKSAAVKTDILTAYKRIEKLLNNFGYSDKSFWARGFYCHHAGVIAEIARENNDRDMLRRMRNEIRLHFDDYRETNAEYPEKLKRMFGLLNG